MYFIFKFKLENVLFNIGHRTRKMNSDKEITTEYRHDNAYYLFFFFKNKALVPLYYIYYLLLCIFKSRTKITIKELKMKNFRNFWFVF